MQQTSLLIKLLEIWIKTQRYRLALFEKINIRILSSKYQMRKLKLDCGRLGSTELTAAAQRLDDDRVDNSRAANYAYAWCKRCSNLPVFHT